jgi:23S rRNA pseudouridine1911/1915/1917 synthase
VHDDFQAQIVNKDHPQGKLARLSYKTIRNSHQRSLLEIELETGRYHQIRVQLAKLGCPIIGDAKYGSTYAYQPQMIALHHGQLQLPHPTTKEWMTFEAPLPSAMQC